MMSSKNRRTHNELFMDRLREMSHGKVKSIGNVSLNRSLKWPEEKYGKVKASLLSKGLIQKTKGKGGAVSLTKAYITTPPKVFISYSHVDEKLKDQLTKHLVPLVKMKSIDTWHDRKIKAGSEWNKEISENLESAEIILILVSVDFINSKYCYDMELDRAIERHEEKTAVVIPIILRSCLWEYTPFSKLHAIPKNGKAVALFDSQDEALTSVAKSVLSIASDLRKSDT